MTLTSAGDLLSSHYVTWRRCDDPERIEALDESVHDGVVQLQWVQLPLKRMQILYWLGYCCPYC